MSIAEYVTLYGKTKLMMLPVVGLERGGKAPAIASWQSKASADSRAVLGSFGGLSCQNIGIATGVLSSLAVLDVDPRHGGDVSLTELEREFGRLPDTPIVHTGGGGEHYYFRASGPMRSRTGIRPGLDFKADGGFVVAPPSLHASGGRYEWDGVLNLETVSLAPLPPWLFALVASHPTASSGERLRTVGELATALVEGKRNNALTSVAGHLLRRYVEPGLVLELLHAANVAYGHPPLPREEVDRIAESVARMELIRRERR